MDNALKKQRCYIALIASVAVIAELQFLLSDWIFTLAGICWGLAFYISSGWGLRGFRHAREWVKLGGGFGAVLGAHLLSGLLFGLVLYILFTYGKYDRFELISAIQEMAALVGWSIVYSFLVVPVSVMATLAVWLVYRRTLVASHI